MEANYNQATLNSPAGTRALDASFVFMDMLKYAQLADEGTWKKNDRNNITICKTDLFTMVICRMHKHAVIMDNLVGGHITIQVMEGAIEYTVETGTTQVALQQVITVHPGIMHSISALEDSLLLITTTRIVK